MKMFSRNCLVAFACAAALSGPAAGREGKARPVVLECYYKAKWGHADEFLQLYKKNHYPVMKRLLDEGRLTRIEIVKPRYHGPEEGRWDFRVTLAFRDADAAYDPEHEEAIQAELYPARDAFREEEKRRFAILDAHWDVIIDPVDPSR
ncbi:MAG: hypothetical protein U0800_02030 [Isosphaeraceae bacterium]